jgi:hypothetical protein
VLELDVYVYGGGAGVDVDEGRVEEELGAFELEVDSFVLEEVDGVAKLFVELLVVTSDGEELVEDVDGLRVDVKVVLYAEEVLLLCVERDDVLDEDVDGLLLVETEVLEEERGLVYGGGAMLEELEVLTGGGGAKLEDVLEILTGGGEEEEDELVVFTGGGGGGEALLQVRGARVSADFT